MSTLQLDALFSDVVYEEESDLPLQFDFAFAVNGDEVYGNIYTPSPSFGNERPVVLFFHGFTGYVRMDDVLMALLRAGCVVASIHHRGAWASQGKYSVTNCIEDAAALAQWTQTDEFCEKYGTSKNAVFLMGHSMGGNTVLNTLCQSPFVKGAILLTPCDVVVLMDRMTPEQRISMMAGNGVEILSYDGVQALIDNVLENANWMNYKAVAERLPECPLMIVTATKDPICQGEVMVDPFLAALETRGFSAPIVRKEYFARHSLMGVRVRLAKDVAVFIEDVLEG